MPLRSHVAVKAGQAAAALSRRLARGGGTVIGGRVTLAIDRRALERLGSGRWIALVSGTNGKTTTTRMLRAAVMAGGTVTGGRDVAINPEGSNLPPGLVAGLASASGAAAALEVDESWLGAAVEALQPRVIVLLNLSRDQLDRFGEVRRTAGRWREVVAAHPEAHVVANADDPLVAWAGLARPERSTVTWVGAGQPWHDDAAGCPSCGASIRFTDESWACAGCGLARPTPDVFFDGNKIVTPNGRYQVSLSLPGRANRANAAMAVAGSARAGVEGGVALAAMGSIEEVDGRYGVFPLDGARARLLLAKNPAGWLEVFEMLAPAPGPVVVAVNARIADGRDPSWLWDVPFERLAGRPLAASGERALDVAVRLRYAGLDVLTVADPLVAARQLAGQLAATVDVAANYTALRDLLARLKRGGVG